MQGEMNGMPKPDPVDCVVPSLDATANPHKQSNMNEGRGVVGDSLEAPLDWSWREEELQEAPCHN